MLPQVLASYGDKEKWKEGRKEGREGRKGGTFMFENVYIVCKSAFQIQEMNITKVKMEYYKGVKMKGQEENLPSGDPDSILCLDLDSVYSRVYFLIILLTEYIYIDWDFL